MTSDARHDPLADLSAQGVAVWLDDLSRELLATSALQSLITSLARRRRDDQPHNLRRSPVQGQPPRHDGTSLRDLAEQGADVDTAVFSITVGPASSHRL